MLHGVADLENEAVDLARGLQFARSPGAGEAPAARRRRA